MSDNPFRDLGFPPPGSQILLFKSDLMDAIKDTTDDPSTLPLSDEQFYALRNGRIDVLPVIKLLECAFTLGIEVTVHE